MDKETREELTQIFSAAIAAVDPYNSVKENLSVGPGVLTAGGVTYPLADIGNIYVIGAGKAAYGMARAAEEVLGDLIKDGAVVTKDGHGGMLEHIELYEASHPVPDARGMDAAERILDFAEAAGEDDLVICLLSGGASALMVLPVLGLTLSDKQDVTRLMLASGADIGEINCVRKHLSAVKGGRLAEAAYPARVLALIVSDVIGDDPGVIASGPTAPDETSYLQAVEILKIRGVYEKLSSQVKEVLEDGCAGIRPETPKPDETIFGRVHNLLVAFNRAALAKAVEVAGYLGYSAQVLTDSLSGEARQAAASLAEAAISARKSGSDKPQCLIVGGETTVTIKGPGKGGRNQEMALAFALGIQDYHEISALFAGTDGTDGPTDAAGAFADGRTVHAAAERDIFAPDYLAENDSYHFFEAEGGLFFTGPTGTNVMDIGIILIG